MSSSASTNCPRCGAALPPNVAPDQCPRCLLGLALEAPPPLGPGGTVVSLPPQPGQRGLPQPGQELGHYRILHLLGGGGMGAVFEAEDLENGRRIALKVLSQALDSPEARQRFLREGRLAASLNHPNSVYVFGTEEIGGTPIITMELMPEGTLQDRVRARGPLPIGEAVDCVLQIIEGLEAAHRLGILHRDIKPSNCYMDPEGTVKIGDFGLSISTTIRTEPALTTTGTFLGTPGFCSPEQLRGEELSARSDMYSVGATLYFLLTGRMPFEADNMVHLLATVLEQRAPSPRKFRPEIPKGLAALILRCLEKQPAERFKHYADLAQALAPYSSKAPTPATFGLRFLAGALDLTLVGTLSVVMNLAVFGSLNALMEETMRLGPKMLACTLAWFGLSLLYFAVLEAFCGATAGKALCRLRVVGPDRTPPSLLRALGRALIFLLLPFAPYWLSFGANPKAYLGFSQWFQALIGFSMYLIMALLFVTARRRNGFAAVQDLLTGTRVISRAALNRRAVLSAAEGPPPQTESALRLGPYHVLQTLAVTEAATWLLGYDLKLLRKVWLRLLSRGTPPLPPPLRSLGRVGRLRWLTGKRSATEDWDAFEAPTGQAFLEVIEVPQPWSQVRYWLHDLATEISAAERDHTLPPLALDRVWITGESRAKLLDFPAPSNTAGTPPALQSPSAFLGAVAAAALTGSADGAAQPAGTVPLPLPVHARTFLQGLTQMKSAEAVAAALKLLLQRAAEVSRLRRAALVAGCAVFPLLACAGGLFGQGFLRDMVRQNPEAMNLMSVLQTRSSGRFWAGKKAGLPTDRQFALFIADHYRSLVTNSTAWTSPYMLAIIKGDNRKFAEQSVTDHPVLTAAERAEADAAVARFVPRENPFLRKPEPAFPAMVLTICLLMYVALPALLAAVAFRGGLLLLITGVTYVRRDGQPASRLRLLWRALLTWGPVVPAFAISMAGLVKHWPWQGWLTVAGLALLAAVSVALPRRGLQDHLAGTWPVPK